MKIIPRATQKTNTITLSVDRTVFVFSIIDSPVSVYCLDCFLVSNLKWWTHVSSWLCIDACLRQNIASDAVFVPLWANSVRILRTAFSCLNFQLICDLQHFLKCLPYMLTYASSIDDHLIPFCGFSSLFPGWSPHLIDHCDIRLDTLNGSI